MTKWSVRGRDLLLIPAIFITILVIYSLLGMVFSSNMANAVLGSALTSLLVLLYYQQTQITSTQTELQREQLELQRSISEAQFKPLFELGPLDIEGDYVGCSLSNLGQGVLRDIHLVTHVEVDENGFTAGPCRVPLNRSVSPETPESPPVFQEFENHLPPESENRHFSGTSQIYINTPDGDQISGSFSEVAEKLSETSVDEIEFEVYIEGRDYQGEKYRKDVTYGSIHDPGKHHVLSTASVSW